MPFLFNPAMISWEVWWRTFPSFLNEAYLILLASGLETPLVCSSPVIPYLQTVTCRCSVAYMPSERSGDVVGRKM